MISSQAFPRLTPQNHRTTSPATIDYNCIAWSAGDVEHWWQPGSYWPISAQPQEFGIDVLKQLFAFLGYMDCGLDVELEPDLRKSLYSPIPCSTPTHLDNSPAESGQASWAKPKISNMTRPTMLPAVSMEISSRS